MKYVGEDFYIRWDIAALVVEAMCKHCGELGRADGEARGRLAIARVEHTSLCALTKAANDIAEAKAAERRHRKMLKQREYRARMRARGIRV